MTLACRRILGLLFSLTLAFGGPAHAQEVLRVGTDATFPPFDPDARYTVGLKAGMVIEPDGDMVAAAWAKNGDKQPSFVFGAPVK